jgi:RNA polymerase sigma-70 factor (ECF subfamily)
VPQDFDAAFVQLFGTEFPRLFRYLDRISGDPDLAADLAQDAFVRLHRRGAMPDRPGIWLVTVALNLFRNARTTAARRRRLLSEARAEGALGGSLAGPAPIREADDSTGSVRAALHCLPEREQQLLLLRAEGYSYREIASVLGLNEASVGTLLARAKRVFRAAYEERVDASE